MARFLEIPASRLEPEVLAALLEEFASRDGTDYGEVETVMVRKLVQLRGRLDRGEMVLLYDSESEIWDLVSRDRADEFLEN